MNPQEAFLNMLIAAMQDAAIEKKCSQLQCTITPEETGKATVVRVIVVPNELDRYWPESKPLGAG